MIAVCWACGEEKDGSEVVVICADEPDHVEFVCFECQDLAGEL